MAALDWLGEVAQWLLSLVPRLRLIRKTHGAVRFTRGQAVVLKPGLALYWPVWSEIVSTPVVRQTINLPYQSLLTSDGTPVVVAVTVVYEVSDPLLALTQTDNILDTIGDLSHWSVKRVVSACSCDELQRGVSASGRKIDGLLRAKLARDLASYGVSIRQAFVSEFTRPVMVRLMGDGMSAN